MHQNKQALIIFVRNPEMGKVKTRLAATIGDEAALAVYQKLLQHTFDITAACAADKFVFYAGEIIDNDLWQKRGYHKRVQAHADLGEKMRGAFATVFAEGFSEVLIIGSDCPELTTAHIEQAFAALKNNDVVIGPASDGGYYLLGMKKLHAALFADKAWSTETVFADTVQAMTENGLQFATLETLTDVDEEKDLPAGWLKTEA